MVGLHHLNPYLTTFFPRKKKASFFTYIWYIIKQTKQKSSFSRMGFFLSLDGKQLSKKCILLLPETRWWCLEMGAAWHWFRRVGWMSWMKKARCSWNVSHRGRPASPFRRCALRICAPHEIVRYLLFGNVLIFMRSRAGKLDADGCCPGLSRTAQAVFFPLTSTYTRQHRRWSSRDVKRLLMRSHPPQQNDELVLMCSAGRLEGLCGEDGSRCVLYNAWWHI